jgi:hypothetical protein
MKKLILAGIAIIIASVSASAQLDLTWGVKGGAQLSTLCSNSNSIISYKPTLGYYGGVEVVAHFSPSSRMVFNWIYSKEGSDYEMKGTNVTGNVDVQYMYDEILYRFAAGRKQRFSADIGIGAGLPFVGKNRMDGVSGATDFYEKMPIFQLQTLLGVNYLIGKHLNIQLRVTPFTTKIVKEGDHKASRRSCQLGLMYSFR